jgi:predicted DNA-binding transcriptional regulator AlpA
MPDLATILANPNLISHLGPDDAAAALTELAGLQVALAARLRCAPTRRMQPDVGEPDRLLEPADVAQRLGVKVRWLYAHADQLPFTRRLGRKVLRFSESGLKRYMSRVRG